MYDDAFCQFLVSFGILEFTIEWWNVKECGMMLLIADIGFSHMLVFQGVKLDQNHNLNHQK